jgi:hypothetical protein
MSCRFFALLDCGVIGAIKNILLWRMGYVLLSGVSAFFVRRGFQGDSVLHQKCIFGSVLVKGSQYAGRPEAKLPEEQLCIKIRFSNLEDDSIATLISQFRDQLVNHGSSDALAAVVGMDCKRQNMDSVFVKLVDHKACDIFVAFCDHADAVSLSQAANKLVLCPRELKASILYIQDEWEISANHPADVAGLI